MSSLTEEINTYNKVIEKNIPSWAKGYSKLSWVSIICILFSLPLNLFEDKNIKNTIKNIKNTENNEKSGNVFIFTLLRNLSSRISFLNNNFLKTIIDILIYTINILFQAIFYKIPDDISTLCMYNPPYYNIYFDSSIQTFGYINVGINLFKNLVIKSKGVDSLLFGMLDGDKDNYLCSLNFWNSVYMANYSGSVLSSYNKFYNSLNTQSGTNGFDNIENDIDNASVKANLKIYLEKASNISIAASAGIYFTLLEIMQGNNKDTNRLSSILSVGGGNPFDDDEYSDDEEESNDNDKIKNVMESLRIYGGEQTIDLQKSEKKW